MGNVAATEIVDFFKNEAQSRGKTKKYKDLNINSKISDLLRRHKGQITKDFKAT